jgi:uncharacterized protein YcbX
MSSLHSIYRYPVKGLTAEPLPSAELQPDRPIAFDRRYALAHGDTPFDPAAPRHLPKHWYLVLMTHPRMAGLKTTHRDGHVVHIECQGLPPLTADLETEDGRRVADRWFQEHLGPVSKGPPRIVSAPAAVLTDIPEPHLSVQNLASIADLGERLGGYIDPLRFRSNLYLAGLPPLAERTWTEGMQFRIGPALLQFVRPTVRCAATNVDPDTAAVDYNVPKSLKQLYGANTMGFYAAVVEGGTVSPGDAVEVLS